MKKIAYIISIILLTFTLTGCNSDKKLVDFELMAGSMVSKDNMTEEEMKMHDAKVIQYGMYQVKQVYQDRYTHANMEKLYNIYVTTTDSLFYDKSPSEWLYTYYTFFEFFEHVGMQLESAEKVSTPFSEESLRHKWDILSREYDDIIAAADKYVGVSFEERAKQEETLTKDLVAILNELNSSNIKIVYRDEDLSHPYIFGTQPEPTRETILFAQDALQRMLKVAPMGEMSTVTLAHVYINQMIPCFNTMLADYDATRYDPTYQTMNPWGVTHGRLWGSWANFMDLVNKTKDLFKTEEPTPVLSTAKEKTLNVDFKLPEGTDKDYEIHVYVDGELQSNLTQTLSPSVKNKTYSFKGKTGIKTVKFKVDGETSAIYDLDFDKETVEELK